jgi:hypothetical protein
MSYNPTSDLIKLKGKDYLEVKYRLVWFRDENPNGSIETELVERGEGWALFKATVTRDNGGKAVAHAQETKKDFPEYLEKAETKAVGRALGMLGYGTQFAPDLDFEESGKDKVVDSPVERKTSEPATECPKCGGEMWDNREKKTNPKAPDFKCKDKDCDGVIWPPKPEDMERTQSATEYFGEFDQQKPLPF